MPFNSIVLNLLLKLDITLISIKFLKNYSNIFLINCLAKCLNQLKLVANVRHGKQHNCIWNEYKVQEPHWSNVQNVLIYIQPTQRLLTLHILIYSGHRWFAVWHHFFCEAPIQHWVLFNHSWCSIINFAVIANYGLDSDICRTNHLGVLWETWFWG